MNMYGCYVVFGALLEPQVHLLDEVRHAALQQGLNICWRSRDRDAARREVLDSVFRTRGAEAALPAWFGQCMIDIAELYDGPHATAVKGICAAIALGRPYSRDQRGSSTDGGGEPVKPQPESPRGNPPAGAHFLQMIQDDPGELDGTMESHLAMKGAGLL